MLEHLSPAEVAGCAGKCPDEAADGESPYPGGDGSDNEVIALGLEAAPTPLRIVPDAGPLVGRHSGNAFLAF